MRRRIILQGGLGNQMFQYALALSLRYEGIDVQLDTSLYDSLKMHNGYELERVFGIREPVIKQKWIHTLWRISNRFDIPYLIKRDNFKYDNSIYTTRALYYNGYWQNEHYFKYIEKIVREFFQFKGLDNRNKEFACEISQKNSVSIHIRRGDYADFGMTIINREYYAKAILNITERVGNPYFYVFSDDMKEAKLLMGCLDVPFQIVDFNLGADSYKDMYLMSKCHHNIIANSSFSWWAAWLNDNSYKIIIAPKIGIVV